MQSIGSPLMWSLFAAFVVVALLVLAWIVGLVTPLFTVLVMAAAGNLLQESGRMPTISVKVGDGAKVVADYLAEHGEVAALVLGAASEGTPGPLVSHFAGQRAGQLPCPLMLVPGGLDPDRLATIA